MNAQTAKALAVGDKIKVFDKARWMYGEVVKAAPRRDGVTRYEIIVEQSVPGRRYKNCTPGRRIG